MKKYYSVLDKVLLFNGIEQAEYESVLSCMGSKPVRIKRDDYALMAGDRPDKLGIVLEGSLCIIREDEEGARAVIAMLSAGDMFAETLCCAGVDESPVSVLAETESVVLYIDFRKIMQSCSERCTHHYKLVENMLYALANKNLWLQNRMDIIGKRTLRQKIVSYLQTFPKQAGGYIAIPFNREEMADFLCVDRSALSHELSRMKRDGQIDYSKNCFRLL